MQPLRLAAECETPFVHVFHLRAGHEIAHRCSKAPQTFGASPPLILAIVAAATLTPKRSAISAARRFSGSNR